jgi:hypothetical protein
MSVSTTCIAYLESRAPSVLRAVRITCSLHGVGETLRTTRVRPQASLARTAASAWCGGRGRGRRRGCRAAGARHFQVRDVEMTLEIPVPIRVERVKRLLRQIEDVAALVHHLHDELGVGARVGDLDAIAADEIRAHVGVRRDAVDGRPLRFGRAGCRRRRGRWPWSPARLRRQQGQRQQWRRARVSQTPWSSLSLGQLEVKGRMAYVLGASCTRRPSSYPGSEQSSASQDHEKE